MPDELLLSIVVNLVVLAFFAGVYVCTIRNHDKKIDDMKEYFSEKIDEVKLNFKEHLSRVEEKQDKHNNLVERTYINERDISVLKEQIKVENHRIEDLEGVQNECFRKGYYTDKEV